MPRDLLSMTLAASLLALGVASAQPVRSFGDIGLRLDVGDRVRVVGTDGQRHEGAVIRLPPGTFTISSPTGTLDITAETTARIARRGDGLANGLLIGALPGVALGVALVNGFSDHSEPASSYLLAGGVLGLVTGGIGALVDALHEGEEAVYVAPGLRAAIAPVVARRAVGVTARLRW